MIILSLNYLDLMLTAETSGNTAGYARLTSTNCSHGQNILAFISIAELKRRD